MKKVRMLLPKFERIKRATAEEILFVNTGGLEIGDVVRSSPMASVYFPYICNLNDKEPYWGVVKGFDNGDYDGGVCTIVKCFDGKIEKRYHYWWILVNEKELEYLRKNYGEFKCPRIRENHIKDYDPLLKKINGIKTKTVRFA